MLRNAAAIALLVCCSMSPAHAAKTMLLRESVVAIFPDASIQLANTGKAAFANILAPQPELLSAWLAEHVLQQEITFTAGDEDRYGRTQITSEVEEKLLRDGAAMIYVTVGDVPASWRAAEAAARGAKRGVWANPSRVLTPQNAAQSIGNVALVEGAITRIYESKSATYLNFGEDWHSDFSITITPKQRRSMKAFLANLKAGDRVRVRGSIIEENGPMIRLNHAGNLERV